MRGPPPGGDVSNWLESGHTDTPAGRPEIEMVPGERDGVVSRCLVILNTGDGGGSLFLRGTTPVVLQFTASEERLRERKRDEEHAGTVPRDFAILRPALPEHVMLALDRRVLFCVEHPKFGKLPKDTPKALAALLLSTGAFRRLTRVSRSPVLLPDGSLLERPGYDEGSGIYYAPNAVYPAVPGRPTREDARAALARLMLPFREFPFAAERDKAVIAALILTLLCRHLVPRAPGFIVRSPEAGTGKTLCVEIASLIGTGTEAPNFSGSILGDERELKKVLTTLTVTAAPVALFDNAARGSVVDSPPLNQFVTAATHSDRLLGGNAKIEAPTTTVIVITGNAITSQGDASRRFLTADLDAKEERPELRAFDFDALGEAAADRPELVAAALTLMRAFILAGRPWLPERGPLGSFEDWDRGINGAVVWAGGADAVGTLDKARASDPEREKLQAVLHHLRRTFYDQKFKAGAAITASLADEELRAALLEVASSPAGQLEAKNLGGYLKQNSGRTTDGLRLVAEWDSDGKTYRYRVLKDGDDEPEHGDAKHEQGG